MPAIQPCSETQKTSRLPVRGAGVPDTVRRLVAGESIEVTEPGTRAAAIAPETSEEVSDEAPRARAREPRAPRASEPLAPTPPDAAAQLAEADHARREGRIDDAIAALERLVAEHPRSSEAPLAEYTRARLLGRMRREDEARAAYEHALSLGLPPALEAARDGARAASRARAGARRRRVGGVAR